MSTSVIDDLEIAVPPSQIGGPTWPVALLFPRQGEWTEETYLALETNRLIELSDGCLEVLPMATLVHQCIVIFLSAALYDHVKAQGLGYVVTAPLPIRLGPGKMREPDVLYLRPNRVSDPKLPPNGADFVIEVLSPGPDNQERDLVTKKEEYAQAGIGEYWIVDPELKRISVLVLDGGQYREEGQYGPGQTVNSAMLPGFQVDVTAVFAPPLGQV
jgi:Uma2 family endonuclease